MVRLRYTQKALMENGGNADTIAKVKSLLNDHELIPVFKVPISVIARATLILLDLEPDLPKDSDVQIWKDNLYHIKKEYDEKI